MRKVDLPAPVSGKDQNLSNLSPEKKPASDPLPKITHAKSEQKAQNAQKNCIKTTQTMSAHPSRQHVASQSKKKSSFKFFGKTLIKNIKDSFQHHHSFSKAGTQKQSSLRADAILIQEYQLTSPDKTKVDWLESGLKKIPIGQKITEDVNFTLHDKQQLSFTIKQCFGLAKGEPTDENLRKLRAVAPKIGEVSPEYKGPSEVLTKKIDDILSKRSKDAGDGTNNQVTPEKSAVPASVDSTPSTETKKLPQPQSTKPAPDVTDEFMAEINKVLDDVPGTPAPPPLARTASANKAATSDEIDSLFKELDYDIFNPPFSTKTNANSVNSDDILNMLNTDTPRSSASATTVASADELESALSDLDDEVKKTKDSDELDEILNELNTDTPGSPTSAKTVTSAEELESALQALNEETKKGE